jgi:hypothetical protein
LTQLVTRGIRLGQAWQRAPHKQEYLPGGLECRHATHQTQCLPDTFEAASCLPVMQLERFCELDDREANGRSGAPLADVSHPIQAHRPRSSRSANPTQTRISHSTPSTGPARSPRYCSGESLPKAARSWFAPVANRITATESLTKKACNGLLQQNLPKADIRLDAKASRRRRCGST